MTATIPPADSPAAADIDQLIALFGSGRYAEMEGRASLLLERHPDSGFAWKALGVALVAQGKEALVALQRTTQLLPDDAAAHNNLGNALRDLGQLDAAVASFRRALGITPEYAEAHSDLGLALSGLGQLEDAVASYRRALEFKPDLAVTHNNLGVVLVELRQLDDALASYRRALEIKSDYADALNNLGNVLDELGRHADAVASYRQALEIDAEFIVALNNLAQALNDQNEPLMALDAVSRSLMLKETADTKNIFVACVKCLRFGQTNTFIQQTLVRALREAWCRPADLALAGANLLKLRQGTGQSVVRAIEAWPQRLPALALFGPGGIAAMVADPLFHALLESAPCCDIDLERFLTMARHTLLDAATAATAREDAEQGAVAFYGTLARQCFINEYVFSWSAEESGRAHALRDQLAAALELDMQVPSLWLIAVASYFPLHSVPFASRLLDRSWPDAVSIVLTQQLLEPKQEQQSRTVLPRLTSIQDEVSLLVQNQYEENPYPRWIKAAPAEAPLTIDSYFRKHFPFAPFTPLGRKDTPDILIAGCGTGQQSIGSAQRFEGARVLAVDLSLTSLCYAKRKTEEIGLHSIEYAQADILKLGTLDRSFDVIESSGVLHHMDDPWDGWRALLSLLRADGLMRLGFYSEVARRDIVGVRRFIAEQGYGATPEDVRRCRQELMDLDDTSDLGVILRSEDFFSTSTCRDLLFHVQEHRMRLSEIEDFLRNNALKFLGFQLEAPVLRAYRARFPGDPAATNFAHWRDFESDHPDTFFGMYQFWVQKAA